MDFNYFGSLKFGSNTCVNTYNNWIKEDKVELLTLSQPLIIKVSQKVAKRKERKH